MDKHDKLNVKKEVIRDKFSLILFILVFKALKAVKLWNKKQDEKCDICQVKGQVIQQQLHLIDNLSSLHIFLLV